MDYDLDFYATQIKNESFIFDPAKHLFSYDDTFDVFKEASDKQMEEDGQMIQNQVKPSNREDQIIKYVTIKTNTKLKKSTSIEKSKLKTKNKLKMRPYKSILKVSSNIGKPQNRKILVSTKCNQQTSLQSQNTFIDMKNVQNLCHSNTNLTGNTEIYPSLDLDYDSINNEDCKRIAAEFINDLSMNNSISSRSCSHQQIPCQEGRIDENESPSLNRQFSRDANSESDSAQELSESVIFSKHESKVKVTSHVYFQKIVKKSSHGKNIFFKKVKVTGHDFFSKNQKVT